MHQAPQGHEAATAPLVARDKAEGLIQLDVLVTDASGNPVPGLAAADLSLLENDRPQTVLSFQAFNGAGSESEPAVKIILVVDTIEMPANLANQERNSVESYLRKNGGRLDHPLAVFLLTDSGLWTVAHPDRDGNVLAREIEHNDLALIRHNRGWQRTTAPTTGDQKDTPSESALKALGQIAADERTRPGRKLLLWIGPGWGLGSGAYAEAKQGSKSPFEAVWWFSTLLREAHLALYSFTVGETDPHALLYRTYLAGVTSPKKASFMNVYRKVLAVQSGGRVIDHSLELVREIEGCVRDAGPFYRISFDPFPADHPNEYHDLKVVVNRPGLTARTTTGYYDQPYYSVDPIPAPRRVSVKQLEQLLTESRRDSDGDLAKRLSELALTERLSEHRLSLLEAGATGKRVRRELRILAGSSAFLDPPADEIPADPPPDLSAQQHMLTLTAAYLGTTIHKLPDFFATQTTERYQETPMYLEGGTSINHQSLHMTDSWTTDVRYRNGFEIAETKPPKRKPNAGELITYGVFGPALKGVLDGIDENGSLTWSRWEQGVTGRMAVFRYTIPWDRSLYEVGVCCLPDRDGAQSFHRYAGYHVQIAIDPQSGAILRLAFQVDLKSTVPLSQSEVMIEYGPVGIGGKTYICPLRSVSIMRARSVRVLSEWDETFRSYGPYATMLNDMRFDRFHIFRSESQVLTDFTSSEK
jgi:VWFA-related protein